jgi:L-asparaginase II
MANPVVVEVLRGERVESAHRGSGAVVDADGRLAFAFGDVERPVYPRSAVKALQALPLVESGAADTFALAEPEIALACGSHGGEERHVALAAAMLARAGRDADALECGAHWPLSDEAGRALAEAGRSPSALHNNCSGKHAGFVCLACAEGIEPTGYVRPDHPVQRAVTAALAEVTGAPLERQTPAVDGCSIPSFAIPLKGLALGFARFTTGRGLGPERAEAARRIRSAVAAAPWAVAGEGRFDSEAMARIGPSVFIKAGAEGVYCAALPDLGLGLAVKADDGGKRAAEVMIAAQLARFGGLGEALAPYVRPSLVNWNKTPVGALRPAGPLATTA